MAQSQSQYQRKVEFEWEVIEGAKTYEIEFMKDEKTQKFKTQEPQWVGPLIPGSYQMRIRAKDKRGVPGDWSPYEELKVGLETPKIISPTTQAIIKTNEDEKHEMKFNWKPVGGAESYQFELSSEDGTINKKEILNKTSFQLELPVAKKYNWKLKADGMGTESDSSLMGEFSLVGKKLKKPEIERPENDFVRILNWSRPEYSENYNLVLQKFNNNKKNWELVQIIKDSKDNNLNFDPKWSGGKYRVQVVAKSNLRDSSDRASLEFQVRSGDRSPAAEEVATIRQSIERLSGWYGIASYLITQINYQGTNPASTRPGIDYNAIGGTGRLGLGYLSSKNPWGFVGIVDLGGMTDIYNRTFTYASSELSAIYRTELGDRGEVRQQVGMFYKEIPEYKVSTRNNGTVVEDVIEQIEYIKAIGPHYGLEYWYAISPKLGFQLNAHLYPSLYKIATPNGKDMVRTLSYQLGALGSYRIKRNITGLMGYAYRIDSGSYKSTVNSSSQAKDGDINTVILQGHYLNFFLEWAL